MRLNSALTFIFLFVSAALSGPLREKDQSWVPNLVKKSTDGTPVVGGYYNSSDGLIYSEMFAGAYWGETDANFTFATATFKVPAQSGQYDYTVFVAFGDIQHNDFTLYAGIHVPDNSETTNYQAWCYLGDSDVYWSKVTITPSDVVRISITALSPTSSVLIENTNNGQADVHEFLVDSTQSLVGQEVSWGVQLAHWNNYVIPFNTVTITNAVAYGSSGKNYEAEGANKIVISRNATIVASVETKESNITIQHVHE